MKKRLTLFAVVIAAVALGVIGVVFAQADFNADNTNGAAAQGGLTQLTNIILDDFELANTWEGMMPRDQGVISVRRMRGGPSEVRAENEDSNRYMLGARVDYFHTGYNWFSVQPPTRIKVQGLAQQFSIWVAGRNYEHKMSLVITDMDGLLYKIGNKKLTFLGWQRVDFNVPIGIKQDEMRMSEDRGISFVGVRIDCDPRFTNGKYYLYLDNLSVLTDAYDETFFAADDPKDNW